LVLGSNVFSGLFGGSGWLPLTYLQRHIHNFFILLVGFLLFEHYGDLVGWVLHKFVNLTLSLMLKRIVPALLIVVCNLDSWLGSRASLARSSYLPIGITFHVFALDILNFLIQVVLTLIVMGKSLVPIPPNIIISPLLLVWFGSFPWQMRISHGMPCLTNLFMLYLMWIFPLLWFVWRVMYRCSFGLLYWLFSLVLWDVFQFITISRLLILVKLTIIVLNH